MTDQEWDDIRAVWRAKVPGGDLRCGEDMVPIALDYHTGEPYAWVSRAYAEDLDKLLSDPLRKASVERAYDSFRRDCEPDALPRKLQPERGSHPGD